MTVSGLTMTKADCQSLQASHSHVQRSRSADVSLGRFTERRRTPSWCRSARFSIWSVARDLKAADVATANTRSVLSVRQNSRLRRRKLYVLIQFDISDRHKISGPRLLSDIANQTGGRAFSAVLMSDLPSVAARIAVELRNQYVLAYYPRNQARDGKYRKVEVKLSQPQGIPLLKAHWRLGYYAPPQ